MRDYKNLKNSVKQAQSLRKISTLNEREEKHLRVLVVRTTREGCFQKAARTAKVLNSKKQLDPKEGQKSLEVLMRRDENLTKERILKHDLKNQARRLEIPSRIVLRSNERMKN